MKQLLCLALTLIIIVFMTGCAIPDLPGPIGIPGI